jgi:pyrimidine-nucleoside phosphorylase
MRVYDIIHKKREGQELTQEEIEFLISSYLANKVSDAQMAAWLMAVCIRGMTARETTALTIAMANSGRKLDLTSIPGVKIDKHSTGGVGDKTTLVLAPLLAAVGIPVVKMSGRSLGHTGGTIDKLESIPGFRTDLTPEEMLEQAKQIGIVLAGIVPDLAPADKKIYALRDLTATVDCTSLIAASVMSKKLAAGAEAILLDVKVGSGAFMHTMEKAEELARVMVEIGQRAGRCTIAVISDMNQPLGRAVGNALEVKEAIETLRGSGPSDLTDLCTTLGGIALVLTKHAKSFAEGENIIRKALLNGSGLEKFRQLVKAQGGNQAVVDNPSLLPSALVVQTVTSPTGGYIANIDAFKIAQAALEVGCGRTVPGAIPNPAAGIYLHKKVGEWIDAGEPLADIHAANEASAKAAHSIVSSAVTITQELPLKGTLIHKIIGPDSASESHGSPTG